MLKFPYYKNAGARLSYALKAIIILALAAAPFLCLFIQARPLSAQTNAAGKTVITVKSKISAEGAMHREVITPGDAKTVEFSIREFFGENLRPGTGENSVLEEKIDNGLVKLSKNFEDAEECAGILMVEKDFYFTARQQIKQSIPQYYDREIMDSVIARFEFELPSPVIKIQRDKKNLSRQFGSFTVNEFVLNAQSNMDLFYQFNNIWPVSAVFIIFAAIFAAAKFSRRLDFILLPLLAIAIAFLFAAIVILAIGESPFAALGAIVTGAFGSKTAALNLLLSATPLIFTGLAVAFAFNCGLFNIGGESQLMIGAFAAAAFGYYINVSSFVHVPLVILAAVISAGLFAAIAGWLKTRFDIHEVISTIMLNYAAYALLGYLVLLPCFKENGPNPQTKQILSSAVLAPFFHRHALNYGLIIAILAALFIWLLLYKTTTGFNIRAVGLNAAAAEYSGVSVSKMMIFAMFVSGALAGLGGAERVMGVFSKYNSTAFVGYGFDGIAVALLVNNNPIGVIFSALLFGFLKTGGAFMNREIGIPVELVIIIQAVIIFFMAADRIVKNILKLKD
ncbi:MAG TPA: ABC transporter permease [Candidatus Wallbacteria bacterium]|nr:MAG: beta-methylgalactoside transporter inner membrane component [bacterium ADurb.Bin243]HPG57359.1 ABC transporter permease [Candidatus Wallbacteria bacterium]